MGDTVHQICITTPGPGHDERNAVGVDSERPGVPSQASVTAMWASFGCQGLRGRGRREAAHSISQRWWQAWSCDALVHVAS